MTNPDNVGGLLPCPFCGGEAQLSDGECGIRGMPMNWRNPRCTRCGCDLGYCHHIEAVERWNRRAELCRAAPAGGDAEARDAARYRWLAENAIIQWPGVTHIGDDPASTRLPLDNAIDAAMIVEDSTGQTSRGDAPCDMGEMCLGCTPRNADGSCPDAAPAGGGLMVNRDSRGLIASVSVNGRVIAENPEYVVDDRVAPAGSGEVEDWMVELFDEVYEREWNRAADEADDRHKAIIGPADRHATREAIAALLRKLQQGADYVVVPREPTRAMCLAAQREIAEYPVRDDANSPVVIYRAMIAASQDQEGGHG